MVIFFLKNTVKFNEKKKCNMLIFQTLRREGMIKFHMNEDKVIK